MHHGFWRKITRGVVACVLILGPNTGVATEDERDAILSAVRAYATAVYARDYAEAYRRIAAADRRLKSLADYEQDTTRSGVPPWSRPWRANLAHPARALHPRLRARVWAADRPEVARSHPYRDAFRDGLPV